MRGRCDFDYADRLSYIKTSSPLSGHVDKLPRPCFPGRRRMRALAITVCSLSRELQARFISSETRSSENNKPIHNPETYIRIRHISLHSASAFPHSHSAFLHSRIQLPASRIHFPAFRIPFLHIPYLETTIDNLIFQLDEENPDGRLTQSVPQSNPKSIRIQIIDSCDITTAPPLRISGKP